MVRRTNVALADILKLKLEVQQLTEIDLAYGI